MIATISATTGFKDPAVKRVFDSYSKELRPKMLALRQLIFDTAATTKGVGELQETLKWGEPAYVTAQTKSGSTIRIDQKRSHPSHYALYFNCQTNLIETFRQLFPTELSFEGNRAIVFDQEQDLPIPEVTFCIVSALTYHRHKSLKSSRI